jgi:hypothetical protein
MVMHLGEVKGIVDADQATQEGLLGIAMSLKEDLQRTFVKPITKRLTFVCIPKLAHPWYDEVKGGIEYGIEEVKKEGIDVEYVWDAPALADVEEENRKIEAAISRQPDGLCVAALDPAKNSQLLDKALQAKISVLTFNAFAGPKYPFVGRHDDVADGYDLAKYLVEKMDGAGNVAILSGSPTAPEHVGRVEGFKKALAEYRDIKIVFEEADNDDLGQAVSLAESALQAQPPASQLSSDAVLKKPGNTSLARDPCYRCVRPLHRVHQWLFCFSLQTKSVHCDPGDVGNLRRDDASHYQRISDPSAGSGFYSLRSGPDLWHSRAGSAFHCCCRDPCVGPFQDSVRPQSLRHWRKSGCSCPGGHTGGAG